MLSDQEMETFLKTGKIIARKSVSTGVTEPVRVTLTDGKITHDAQIQNVDIFKSTFEVDAKHTEFNFHDTYRYNIAAYRLGHLLGLKVPMSVPRKVDGKDIAMTWWVDDVAMDEMARQKSKDPLGPNPSRTALQLHMVRVFDELIQNRDRNQGNLIWTKDWTMWIIDHTRAFRTDKKLLEPEKLEICERNLFEAMKGLTRDSIAKAVGDSLTKAEIDPIIPRRDAIVKVFNDKIAKKGEASVIVPMP
jgi:hypothetical protein